MSLSLFLKWSWRDLRARWIQVVTIALVIGLGTGSFASLNSLAVWRTLSNEASFAATKMYDLRIRLSVGSFLSQGSLTAALSDLEDPSLVQASAERLIMPTQVDVSTDSRSVLVPGRLIGMDVSSESGPTVNDVHVTSGRALTPNDTGDALVLLESKFAETYALPSEGEVQLAGGQAVRYVGHALAPEYFIVLTGTGGFYAHANFGVVFTSLETAQELTALPGLTNDLVLQLSETANPETTIADLESVFAERFPEVGMTVMQPLDDPSFRVLTEDVEGDQQSSNVIAFAIFIGAVFAAFNLTTRMVESQRREIGVAMALGVPKSRIALRPLLVGAQIALLGMILGVGVGLLIGQALRGVMEDLIPLPVAVFDFQPSLFFGVAVAGFIVPILAITYPVWRAVRVRPIEAIQLGHLAARGGGLAPLLKRLSLPGATFGQLPFRNVVRAPRRAMLTLFGIAAAIAVMVAVLGLVDSLLETIQDGERETLQETPERLGIDLVAPLPVQSPIVQKVLGSSTISTSEPTLRVGGALVKDDTEFDVIIQVVDFESDLWQPTIVDGEADTSRPGVILPEKAAADLGVRVGDDVTVEHPVRQGPTSFTLTRTDLPVLATHPHPFRVNVYLDTRHADLLGMEGTTNRISALPAEGADLDMVKRQMFGLEGVASVDTVAGEARVIEDLISQFLGLLQVMEAVPLLLALLIAYNTASISTDERAREHATMFAFGVPYRTVLRMAVIESSILGVLGTLLGLLGGLLLMAYMLQFILTQTMPDMGVVFTLSAESVGVALGLGVLAVAAAPLLTFRKLRRMDIPSTLRVME